MYVLDVLIMGSSRPQLFPYCWESFKKYFHFEGKMNVYYHEDFVFPTESNKVLDYLKEQNIRYDFHNPAIGLGKGMDFMFKNRINNKYMFNLQEDWEFERHLDIDQMIYVMEENPGVNMIGLNKIKNNGSINGAAQPQYTYSGLDMILYHGWAFTPGLWNMDFVRKHWRVRVEHPEGYFTNAFGDHKTRMDCEYCRKNIGAYMLGKTGDWRYIRHIGNDWRMAKWQLENGKPGGRHDPNTMDLPYRAPWLLPFEERPHFK